MATGKRDVALIGTRHHSGITIAARAAGERRTFRCFVTHINAVTTAALTAQRRKLPVVTALHCSSGGAFGCGGASELDPRRQPSLLNDHREALEGCPASRADSHIPRDVDQRFARPGVLGSVERCLQFIRLL